ncbi:non-hydrolyzing UDP-N-acetylglucosamine 2-epimerase [Thiolapillus brandeum]|uniref:UDP-N-acetylglucosamine 2-epimerase (non-hydrolyzing) n=1 Tax=Thiolapillus brandeum TaxID=1076588 RepID=A0A7U6GL18_9GAMM|nr:UDP-N-acetylglucosamine 2-epimerase (non-hydrolyzing) [Thiolapillus brandeum]BAO45543.1 UDP-N-acetylglucosamine 2-epimerase [Thiolapillus brandeum]
MKKVLFIFGTRPEAIKMSPLISRFREDPDRWKVAVCVTAQHREMLDQVLEFFQVDVNYDLDLMTAGQSLTQLTARCLVALEHPLMDFQPDVVFVQGDTTTVLTGALAAYYQHIPVAHIEAGLRSGDRYSPFPEELNRMLAGRLAEYHFAPTPAAVASLAAEGVRDNVWMVGNTVIDALQDALTILEDRGDDMGRHFPFLDASRKLILVTGHRRESFGKPFESICGALADIASAHDDVQIVYPVHLNPNVQEPVRRILAGRDNVHLIEPLDYARLVWLMSRAWLVLTDSGGIQEEAPSLGVPVLVMRDVTERMEGVQAGTAKLVGTDRQVIVREALKLIEEEDAHAAMANAVNPYGDGTTARQVVRIMDEILNP